MKIRKKYPTGGMVNDYVITPQEVLAENQYNANKAKTQASTGFTDALDVLSPLLIQLGTSGISKGLGAGEKFKDLFPYGGTIENINVELEGGEVAQTPDGEVMSFKGPKHKNGGIDITLPEGTEIYSNRISKDGQTMSDRKLMREKNSNRIKKELDKNPFDKPLQNSFNRIAETNQNQENMDIMLQNIVNQFSKNYAYGGKIKKYQDGGSILKDINPFDLATTFINTLGAQRQKGFAQQSLQEPNVNYFKDFGQQSLKNLNEIEQLINQNKQTNLSQIETGAATSRKRAANTARSVNTLRGLNLEIDKGARQQRIDIENQANSQLANLLGQKASLNSQVDQVVAQGETARDQADRSNELATLSALASADAGVFGSIASGFQNLKPDDNSDIIKKLYAALATQLNIDIK